MSDLTKIIIQDLFITIVLSLVGGVLILLSVKIFSFPNQKFRTAFSIAIISKTFHYLATSFVKIYTGKFFLPDHPRNTVFIATIVLEILLIKKFYKMPWKKTLAVYLLYWGFTFLALYSLIFLISQLYIHTGFFHDYNATILP